MAVTLVQSAAASAADISGSVSVTLGAAPTSGNLLVAAVAVRSGSTVDPSWSTWTWIGGAYSAGGPTNGHVTILFYRVAGAGESASITSFAVGSHYSAMTVMEFSGVGAFDVATTNSAQSGTSLSVGPITPSAAAEVLLVGTFAQDTSSTTFTPGASFTEVTDSSAFGFAPSYQVEYRVVVAPSGSYSATATGASGNTWGGVIAAFVRAPVDPEPGGGVLDPTGDTPLPITDSIVSWTITRGAGAEVTSGANPGAATVIVKNTDDQFNPENDASPYAALLRDGTAIWLGVNSDGVLTGANPRGLFGGRITDITVLPSGGATTAPLVEILCEDVLGWLGRVEVQTGFVVGLSQKAFRQAVLDASGETRYDLDHEIHTITLASADGNALSILEALNHSNGTRHFARPTDDSTQWYEYVTQNRQHGLDGSTAASLSALTDHVTSTSGWRLTADTVTNQQKATVTPITFTPNTYTVWRPESLPISLSTARSFVVWAEFDDYVDSPVLNLATSGSAVSSTLTVFGTTAKIELSTSGTASVTALSIEGRLARRWPDVSHVANDTASQAFPRGVRAGSEISGEYVGSLAAAQGIAEHVVWRYGNPQIRPTLTVVNWFPTMFDLDLGDVIAFTSPQLGVTNRHMEIVGLTHVGEVAATAAQSHTVTYVLQECRVQSDPGWFTWGSSVWGGSDVLGY